MNIINKILSLFCLLIFMTDNLQGQESSPSDSVDNPIHQVSADILSPSITVKRDSVSLSSLAFTDNMSIYPKMHSIFEEKYSMTYRDPDWKRLWINTATLTGVFVGTLFVLECLPEDATSWNRAEIRNVPLFKRWRDHVIKEGPAWDHDKVIFNYVLHPYAGAVYYMAARSNGFNVWQSLLYCSIISNVCWEFGIEAFMERPSIQDMLVTPLIGSAIGEGFYLLKRKIVENGYTLAGSKILGNIVVFLIDPVNEVIGLFAGNPCRQLAKKHKIETSFAPSIGISAGGGSRFGFSCTLVF